MNNFIDDKIIIPMNEFADKHPNMPLIISIIALLIVLVYIVIFKGVICLK